MQYLSKDNPMAVMKVLIQIGRTIRSGLEELPICSGIRWLHFSLFLSLFLKLVGTIWLRLHARSSCAKMLPCG